jgi:hypothetical protein
MLGRDNFSDLGPVKTHLEFHFFTIGFHPIPGNRLKIIEKNA